MEYTQNGHLDTFYWSMIVFQKSKYYKIKMQFIFDYRWYSKLPVDA